MVKDDTARKVVKILTLQQIDENCNNPAEHHHDDALATWATWFRESFKKIKKQVQERNHPLGCKKNKKKTCAYTMGEDSMRFERFWIRIKSEARF